MISNSCIGNSVGYWLVKNIEKHICTGFKFRPRQPFNLSPVIFHPCLLALGNQISIFGITSKNHPQLTLLNTATPDSAKKWELKFTGVALSENSQFETVWPEVLWCGGVAMNIITWNSTKNFRKSHIWKMANLIVKNYVEIGPWFFDIFPRFYHSFIILQDFHPIST